MPRSRPARCCCAALGASPARADHCDDLANQLKDQIDGLKVGITAANIIYLSHPLAKELSLGCRGRNYTNELYAKTDGRKPKPAFLDLVGSATAIVFTLPKDDTLTGTTRCMKRMGLLRGDTIKMRYRRLDYRMHAAPRPRRRSRSPAARNGAKGRTARPIATIWKIAVFFRGYFSLPFTMCGDGADAAAIYNLDS